MEKPLVSVITITRNRGNLLKRCISSVLSQTYTNIEHIVVDGASDDNTDEVVASFIDERLRFDKLDYNWPLKETMDHALEMCRGKYISFLDSDDEYLPTKVEKQVELIESLPEDYGFVYCWMTYHDSANNNLAYRVHKPQLRGFVAEEVVGEPLISGTPTLLFKLAFFRKLGGWKSIEEIGIASDWEMCARACQLTKVDFVPESLVNVYVNHGSVRQSESKLYYNNYNERLIKFHSYFLKEFSDVFKRHPKFAESHYLALIRSYSRLKNRGKALSYYVKYLKNKPSFTAAVKLLGGIVLGC